MKENIARGFVADVKKGKKTGYYTDTAENRAKFRVGQKYSKEKKEHPHHEKIKLAGELGKEAYHAGLTSVPNHDKNLTELLSSIENRQMGDAIPFYKNWSRAWHREHIAEVDRELKESGFWDNVPVQKKGPKELYLETSKINLNTATKEELDANIVKLTEAQKLMEGKSDESTSKLIDLSLLMHETAVDHLEPKKEAVVEPEPPNLVDAHSWKKYSENEDVNYLANRMMEEGFEITSQWSDVTEKKLQDKFNGENLHNRTDKRSAQIRDAYDEIVSHVRRTTMGFEIVGSGSNIVKFKDKDHAHKVITSEPILNMAYDITWVGPDYTKAILGENLPGGWYAVGEGPGGGNTLPKKPLSPDTLNYYANKYREPRHA
jgi:hypothetical protein